MLPPYVGSALLASVETSEAVKSLGTIHESDSDHTPTPDPTPS